MNKKLMIGLGVGALVAAGCAAAARKHESGPPASMWDKMRKGFAEMPADLPPRVMFDNIEAIKSNTDEMLRLMREQTQPRESADAV